MASNVVEVRISDLPEVRRVLDSCNSFADAARPLFDSSGPVTGSPEWQAAWKKAVDALASLTAAKAAFPRPLEPPPTGTLLLCMICAEERPWGVFDGKTGAAVCIGCRDKARS